MNASMISRGRLMALILAVFTLATVSRAADEKKVDVTGTWKWTLTTPNGDEINLSAKLKQEGEKVTGTYYGRNNTETPIKDGKINGTELKFTVVRDFNGSQVTITYSGKVMGDAIDGKSEFKTQDADARTMDWKAKREKDAK